MSDGININTLVEMDSSSGNDPLDHVNVSIAVSMCLESNLKIVKTEINRSYLGESENSSNNWFGDHSILGHKAWRRLEGNMQEEANLQ